MTTSIRLVLLGSVALAVGCGGSAPGDPAAGSAFHDPATCSAAGDQYLAALEEATSCTPGTSQCTLRPTSQQQGTGWCTCQRAIDAAKAAQVDALFAQIPAGCSQLCPPCPLPAGAAGGGLTCGPVEAGASATCH